MRIPIAMALPATVALSPAPLMAQAYNDTNTADAANTAAPAPEADANAAAVPPADANMVMANEMMPVDDIAVAEETYAEPVAPRSSRSFPWGVLGLLGLVGLLGRRRSSS